MKPLTDEDNAILRKIASDARNGGWVTYPQTEFVAKAVRHLRDHGMISHQLPNWRLVRVTAKGRRHIEARKNGKPYRANRQPTSLNIT